MSLTTAELQSEIDTLTKAMGTGVMEVTTDSNGVRRTVKYHSLAEMMKARATLQAELNAMIAGSANTTATLAGFTRR